MLPMCGALCAAIQDVVWAVEPCNDLYRTKKKHSSGKMNIVLKHCNDAVAVFTII